MTTPKALRLRSHLSRWLRRYLPAELAGTTSALLCAWLASSFTPNAAVAALAFTWGENLAYYGLMLGRELRGRRGARAIGHAVRNLALEFGPAEALDSFLLRPACLLAALSLVPRPELGLIAGKLAADVTFYAPAIAMHELVRARTAARRVLGGAIALALAVLALPAAGTASAQPLDVGTPVFEYELTTDDGAIVAGDGQQHPGPIDASYAFPNQGTMPFERKLQAFATAAATTFWVTATSARETAQSQVVGGTSRLSFYQSFRKDEDGATLRFRMTKLLLEALHFGAPGGPTQLQGEIAVTVKAFTSTRVLSEFHAIAYLRGRSDAWDAGVLGDWAGDIQVAIDASSGSRRKLELVTPYPIEVDLSGVGIDEDGDGEVEDEEREFSVRYEIQAEAIDDVQEEVDWIRAYARDPADVGGSGVEVEGSGLVATNAPAAEPFAGLEPRNLDADPLTFEAHYDPALDVTWLADANLARTQAFGVPGIDANGGMDWQTANAWIDALNATVYLGVDDWRLPQTRPADGVAFDNAHEFDGSTDVGYSIGAPGTPHAGSTGSEMTHLYYTTLANPPAYDFAGDPTGCSLTPSFCLDEPGPFAFGDIAVPGGGLYWSGTEVTTDLPGHVYTFDFATGFQGVFEPTVTNLWAWPVVSGDVQVPEPRAAATFLASAASLAALKRRRERQASRRPRIRRGLSTVIAWMSASATPAPRSAGTTSSGM
jgi:hypothetical protein